jgi:hypothetical protein
MDAELVETIERRLAFLEALGASYRDWLQKDRPGPFSLAGLPFQLIAEDLRLKSAPCQ